MNVDVAVAVDVCGGLRALLIVGVRADASSPGAPTALTFFCSTCNDDPDTTKSGAPDQDRDACPAGTIVPGLELFVTTYPNNTGSITQGRFDNCAQTGQGEK